MFSLSFHPFFLLLISLGLLASPTLPAQEVHMSGAMHRVMAQGDLSATVQLDSLLDEPHLFALGPVAGLQGEIMAFDGRVYVSRMQGEALQLGLKPQVQAPFLVYSHVAAWQAHRLEGGLRSLADLQAQVAELGQQAGLSGPFPFRLSGRLDTAAWHVIDWQAEQPHSHAAHKAAQRRWRSHGVQAELLGFYSTAHEGVFTHRGEYVHVHYLSERRAEMGHLDEVQASAPLTLWLPAGPQAPSIEVLDTEFAEGRLGLRQTVQLDDLVRLHGHRCDGLVVGYLGLREALYRLYPDSVVDRTNTRILSRPSPCLTDAAVYLSGGRAQFGTFAATDSLPGLYVVQRLDTREAWSVALKPGVKPAIIPQMAAQAVARELSPCDLDRLQAHEEAFTRRLLREPDPASLYELSPRPAFAWPASEGTVYPKTDVLNKDLPPCEER